MSPRVEHGHCQGLETGLAAGCNGCGDDLSRLIRSERIHEVFNRERPFSLPSQSLLFGETRLVEPL